MWFISVCLPLFCIRHTTTTSNVSYFKFQHYFSWSHKRESHVSHEVKFGKDKQWRFRPTTASRLCKAGAVRSAEANGRVHLHTRHQAHSLSPSLLQRGFKLSACSHSGRTCSFLDADYSNCPSHRCPVAPSLRRDLVLNWQRFEETAGDGGTCIIVPQFRCCEISV